MARPTLTEAARVSIALKVSQVDAARIDEVLTRPEFAGWTRAEWCREIIRTALRYYVRDTSAPDPGQGPVPARPAAAQPVPPEPVPPEPVAASAPGPAVRPRSQAGEPGAGGAAAAAPMPPAGGETGPGSREALERPADSECPHPAEARDWQTGTCAACGAILWD
jgi:hypothetical protein